jgi:hypothetical protein
MCKPHGKGRLSEKMKEIQLKNNTAEELQLVEKVQVKVIIFGGLT